MTLFGRREHENDVQVKKLHRRKIRDGAGKGKAREAMKIPHDSTWAVASAARGEASKNLMVTGNIHL